MYHWQRNMQLSWFRLATLLWLAGCYDTTAAPDALVAKQAYESAPSFMTESEWAATLADRPYGSSYRAADKTVAILLSLPPSCEELPDIGVRSPNIVLAFADEMPDPDSIKNGRAAQADFMLCYSEQGLQVQSQVRMGVDGLAADSSLFLEFVK